MKITLTDEQKIRYKTIKKKVLANDKYETWDFVPTEICLKLLKKGFFIYEIPSIFGDGSITRITSSEDPYCYGENLTLKTYLKTWG